MRTLIMRSSANRVKVSGGSCYDEQVCLVRDGLPRFTVSKEHKKNTRLSAKSVIATWQTASSVIVFACRLSGFSSMPVEEIIYCG